MPKQLTEAQYAKAQAILPKLNQIYRTRDPSHEDLDVYLMGIQWFHDTGHLSDAKFSQTVEWTRHQADRLGLSVVSEHVLPSQSPSKPKLVLRPRIPDTMQALPKRSPYAIPSLSMTPPGASYPDFDSQKYRPSINYQPQEPTLAPFAAPVDFNTPSAYDPPTYQPEPSSNLIHPPGGSTDIRSEPPKESTGTKNQSTFDTQNAPGILDVEGFLDWLHSSEAAEMAIGLGLLPSVFSESTQAYLPDPTTLEHAATFSGTVPALTITGPPTASLPLNHNSLEHRVTDTARGRVEILRRTVSPQNLLKPPELASSIIKLPENDVSSYPSPPVSNSRSRAASVGHSSATDTPSPEPVNGISISRFSRASNPSIPRRHSVQLPIPPPMSPPVPSPMQRKDPHKSPFIPSAFGYDSNPPPPRIVKIAPDNATASSHQPKSRTPSVLKPGRIPEERQAMPSVLVPVEANDAAVRRSAARPTLSGRSYVSAYAVPPHNTQPSRKRRHSSLDHGTLPYYTGKRAKLEKPGSRVGGTLPGYPSQLAAPASVSNFTPQQIGQDATLSLAGVNYLRDIQQSQQSLGTDLLSSDASISGTSWDPQMYGAWNSYIQQGSLPPEFQSYSASSSTPLLTNVSFMGPPHSPHPLRDPLFNASPRLSNN